MRQRREECERVRVGSLIRRGDQMKQTTESEEMKKIKRNKEESVQETAGRQASRLAGRQGGRETGMQGDKHINRLGDR